jgi:hypothetical protein
MASGGLSVEKLRHYLRDLKPEARALLIAELERGLLRGQEVAGGDLILQELRRTMRASGGEMPQIGDDAARQFFRPFEPFIVNDKPNHSHRGRIARASLGAIWSWVSRDLMPAESKALGDEIDRAVAGNDLGKAELLARALQDRALERLHEVLGGAKSDDKVRRRLAGQVGTPRGIDDLNALHAILKSRDTLAAIGQRLPGHISNLAGDQLANCKALLDSYAARNADVFLYGLLLIMSRLTAPWQLIRLGVKAAESDDADRIAHSPYAVAVTIVLDEIQRMIGELREDLKSGSGVAVISLLKTIHDAARGLRTEINLAGDSAWGRQLATIRTEISNMLKAEIESMPGRVRRLLRPRASKDIPANSVLDGSDVEETEALVEFVGACRNYASELAINEMTMRTNTELQHYLETGTEPLLDGLRQASDADRPFRQSQLDAAVRFCRKVFGQDYAAQLAKAVEVAAHAAQAERKVAKV